MEYKPFLRDLSAHVDTGEHLDDGMLDRIIETVGGAAETTAYMGDDLPDIALMARVGLSIAVADAHEHVRRHADWVTAANGGCGAVREVCEMLLQAQGIWDKIIERF